jgi:hypothetical protein
MDSEIYTRSKSKAKIRYKQNNELFCPFFNKNIKLNSDGFHHLQFSLGRERPKKEQSLKFKLLPLALEIINKSGTLQEYRRTMEVAHKGRFSNKKGSEMKEVEYWGFTSIVSDPKIRVKAILRKCGNGDVHFWSVMPDMKLGGADQYKKLYSTDMEND